MEDHLRQLRHPQAPERLMAARALAGYQDERLVQPLLAALKDRDLKVRREAILALGNQQDERALEPLLVLLTHKEFQLRKAAAEALGELNLRRATLPLTQALFDPRLEVFLAAVGALATLKDQRCVKLLKVALKSRDEFTSQRASKALTMIGIDHDQPPDWALALKVVQDNGISGRESRYRHIDLEGLMDEQLVPPTVAHDLSLASLLGGVGEQTSLHADPLVQRMERMRGQHSPSSFDYPALEVEPEDKPHEGHAKQLDQRFDSMADLKQKIATPPNSTPAKGAGPALHDN